MLLSIFPKHVEDRPLHRPIRLVIEVTFHCLKHAIKSTLTFLSQPNNNHNPNNKATITVVGLRLCNHWEPPPPPPPPQTQNYMIELKLSNSQKTKVISLYKETPIQFFDQILAPKSGKKGP